MGGRGAGGRLVGIRVQIRDCSGESKCTSSALRGSLLSPSTFLLGIVMIFLVADQLRCDVDGSLHIYSKSQDLTSFKGEFARWVRNGVLGAKKKNNSVRVTFNENDLPFSFSILVVLNAV